MPIADITPVATIGPPLNVVNEWNSYALQDPAPPSRRKPDSARLLRPPAACSGGAGRIVGADHPPLAERLAAYADRLRYDDLDAATIERVKAHVIDALGCGIAAFDENPVRICREVALAHAGDTSSVIGTDRRVTPDLATFANGAAIRYYDLNDVYVDRHSTVRSRSRVG